MRQKTPGEVIRAMRSLLGITTEEAAQRLGMKKTAFNHLETGRTNSDEGDILRVARLLGVDDEDVYALAGPVMGGGDPMLRCAVALEKLARTHERIADHLENAHAQGG